MAIGVHRGQMPCNVCARVHGCGAEGSFSFPPLFKTFFSQFDANNVYVCESAYYDGKPLFFKRLRQWPFEDNIDSTPRDEPLMLRRQTLGKTQEDEETDHNSPIDRKPEVMQRFSLQLYPIFIQDVVKRSENTSDPTYYDQLCVECDGRAVVVRVGDGVYIDRDNAVEPDIVRADRLWRDERYSLLSPPVGFGC